MSDHAANEQRQEHMQLSRRLLDQRRPDQELERLTDGPGRDGSGFRSLVGVNKSEPIKCPLTLSVPGRCRFAKDRNRTARPTIGGLLGHRVGPQKNIFEKNFKFLSKILNFS